jgi:hypothetical protein
MEATAQERALRRVAAEKVPVMRPNHVISGGWCGG